MIEKNDAVGALARAVTIMAVMEEALQYYADEGNWSEDGGVWAPPDGDWYGPLVAHKALKEATEIAER